MIKFSLYSDGGSEPSTDNMSSVDGADGVGDVVKIMVSRSGCIGDSKLCELLSLAIVFTFNGRDLVTYGIEEIANGPKIFEIF